MEIVVDGAISSRAGVVRVRVGAKCVGGVMSEGDEEGVDVLDEEACGRSRLWFKSFSQSAKPQISPHTGHVISALVKSNPPSSPQRSQSSPIEWKMDLGTIVLMNVDVMRIERSRDIVGLP